MAKQVTREQAERKKAQAAPFVERIGEPDRADEFDDMSVDYYAARRGLHIASNPRRCGRNANVATKLHRPLSFGRSRFVKCIITRFLS